MKVKTPANFFRVASPAAMLFLVLMVLTCRNSFPGWWWFIIAFVVLASADSITYGFHYPQNKVLFIQPLSTDNNLLLSVAREWQIGNLLRILLMAVAIVFVMLGLFSII